MADKSIDAGFFPESLDPILDQAIKRLDSAVVDIERIRGTIEPHLDAVRERLIASLSTSADPAVLDNAERLIDWLEKYARATLNLGKLIDQTTRLRSFVAGGADSRPDLAALSDSELAKIVQAAAASLKK